MAVAGLLAAACSSGDGGAGPDAPVEPVVATAPADQATVDALQAVVDEQPACDWQQLRNTFFATGRIDVDCGGEACEADPT
jgi:hypothetical protein